MHRPINTSNTLIMKKGILIVFGNIDFGVKPGEIGEDDQAIVNEIYHSRVITEDMDPNQTAEDIMSIMGYNSYIIPQLYPGTIIWKQ